MAITNSLPGSINAPLGALQESGVNAYGGVSVLKFTGLSSDVKTTAVNLGLVSGGDVVIENIYVETDGTGFATGTNLQFGTDDTVGLAVFWAEAVSNLGANKTIDITTASVTKQKTVIHSGKHLQISSSVASCTGAGVWNAYVLYRPTVQSATIQ